MNLQEAVIMSRRIIEAWVAERAGLQLPPKEAVEEQTARDPKLKLKHFMRKPDAFDEVFEAGAQPPCDGAIKQPEPPARAKPCAE